MTSSTVTRRLTVFVLTLVLLAVTVLPIAAVSYPRAIDYVADDADVLTDETAANIKKVNKSLNMDTGCRVSVCTVRTTGAIDIAEYANGVFSNWKLGEGVLLLLSTDDKSYYLLPSTGVESVLTTEVLTEIRDTVLEPDFAAGDFDHAAAACVNKLAATMSAAASLQKTAAQTAADTAATTAPAEAKSTTAGSVIVTLLKVILWLVIIAVVAFVVLFIAALFNDTAAEFLANTVFRKNHRQQSFHMAESDYDERLYGRPQQANGQRTASGNRPYPTNGQRSVDGQRSYPANGQRPANGQPNRNANNPYRPQNGSYDYTGRRTR